MDGIVAKDFQLVNKWIEKTDPKNEKVLEDASTGRHYLNEPTEVVGTKCFLLTLGTPLVHIPAALVNLAVRIIKLATLAHFWRPSCCEKHGTLKARATRAKEDLLRLLATPISLIALELSALYGLFRPYDGRKLYASIERAMYGSFILAPCFQPNPTQHLFGGDLKDPRAW